MQIVVLRVVITILILAPIVVTLITSLFALATPPLMAQPAQLVPTATRIAQKEIVFPRLLHTAEIAPGESEIQDFRRDPQTGRLFATDTSGQLTVLDGESYAVLAQFAMQGDLLMDEASRRIYIYPGESYVPKDETPTIHLLDMDTLETLGTIRGAYVTLDSAKGVIYTGDAYSPYASGGENSIRRYDAATLEVTGEISRTGIPVYNPVRAKLLVIAQTALVLDSEGEEVIADLLPEISAQTIPFCNGCDYAQGAVVFPEENVIVVELNRMATGGGAGFYPGPRFFNATTLEPIALEDLDAQFLATCGSQTYLQPPIDGRIYRNRTYARYVFHQNWLVEDSDGNRLALRDGLYANFVNPTTHQAFVQQGYVLDLATLQPIGRFPSFCWLGYEQEIGQSYGKDGGNLLIMAERGGDLPVPPPAVTTPLPAARIHAIVPSPNFAADATLFVMAAGAGIYRSRDGGTSWEYMRGGLPEDGVAALKLTLSPNFGQDQTLFVSGYERTYRGEGVLRSEDGGDSWQPQWAGLEYLRIHDLAVSPDFAADATVVALAEFNILEPWISGRAIYRSTDRGASWTQIITDTSAITMPVLSDYFTSTVAKSTVSLNLPVRVSDFGQALEVSKDGGITWREMALGLEQYEYLSDVVPAPDYPADPALYVWSRNRVWRTVDDGATWQQWQDARLDETTDENELTALALVRGDQPNTHRLLIGTAAGDVWVLTPSTAASAAAVPLLATPVATMSAPATMTATIVAPIATTAMPSVTRTPLSPQPTVTSVPLAGEPPAGLFRPTGPVASRWESDPRLQQELGWAKTATAEQVSLAYQDFMRGSMIWMGDTQQIVVLYPNNRWELYEDTFVEGEAEVDHSLQPPSGYLQPIRGFGKIWRATTAVREGLGWAVAKEQGYGGYIHEFEHGLLITAGTTVALIEQTDGTRIWR